MKKPYCLLIILCLLFSSGCKDDEDFELDGPGFLKKDAMVVMQQTRDCFVIKGIVSRCSPRGYLKLIARKGERKIRGMWVFQQDGIWMGGYTSGRCRGNAHVIAVAIDPSTGRAQDFTLRHEICHFLDDSCVCTSPRQDRHPAFFDPCCPKWNKNRRQVFVSGKTSDGRAVVCTVIIPDGDDEAATLSLMDSTFYDRLLQGVE